MIIKFFYFYYFLQNELTEIWINNTETGKIKLIHEEEQILFLTNNDFNFLNIELTNPLLLKAEIRNKKVHDFLDSYLLDS